MKSLVKSRITYLWMAAFGILGLGIGLGMSNPTIALEPQAKGAEKQSSTGKGAAEAKAPASAAHEIPAPPTDVNELSMEVAALRTLYLLGVWPDQSSGAVKYYSNGPWVIIHDVAHEKTAEPARTRKAAAVSPKYRKVLADLRAALIAGQDDKILDLSDQLEDLTEEEDFEIDDNVQLTDQAKKDCARVLNFMSPERIVNYLNSYGKDFPSPIDLIGQTIVDRDAGQKISPETREFVLKEVSWQLGGFAKEKEFAAKIGELLDKANAMTPEECKKAWLLHGPLRAEFEKVRRTTAGNVTPLTMLEHVMKQDIAELLSNSRLLPAMDARISYLKKAGYDMEKKAYHKDDVK